MPNEDGKNSDLSPDAVKRRELIRAGLGVGAAAAAMALGSKSAQAAGGRKVTDYVPFPAAMHESPPLARSFVEAPATFASAMGVPLESLITCPPEAHAAFARGQAFVARATAGVTQWNSSSIERLELIATQHFGLDFKVNFIPFGLRFREEINIPTIAGGGGGCASDVTATASGTITFADGDGDVDG